MFELKCLGVTLDRALTYRQHLESFREKLTSRMVLLRRLAGLGWGPVATTLRSATLALVHSTVEYCAPVWCRSAHTCLTDSVINDTLRTVTGCLRPTPADNLATIAGIQPAEIRRREPYCLQHAAPWTLGICSIQRSPVHRVGMYASQIETPICTRCTTTHHFI